jgi:hypothetical protein
MLDALALLGEKTRVDALLVERLDQVSAVADMRPSFAWVDCTSVVERRLA